MQIGTDMEPQIGSGTGTERIKENDVSVRGTRKYGIKVCDTRTETSSVWYPGTSGTWYPGTGGARYLGYIMGTNFS